MINLSVLVEGLLESLAQVFYPFLNQYTTKLVQY
jgi:hypothetical protein